MATAADLCPQCRRAWLAWLDYRLPPAPIPLTAAAAYDLTAAGHADRIRARTAQWRSTILAGHAGVVAECVAGRHVPA